MSFPLHRTGASDAAGLDFFLGGESRLWGMRGIMGCACMCLPPAQLRREFAVSMGPSAPWSNSPSRNTSGTTLACKAAVTAQH